jgi:hypothetical protein
MIGGMRVLAGRLLIGLAAVAAGVMAVGYALIFGGIAGSSDDLGTLAVPADGQVVATRLDDGLPVFVSVAGGTAWVLDAREPHEAGELGVLVGWCPADEAFVGSQPTSIFAADGSMLRPGPGGLTAHATSAVGGDASRIRVDAQTSVRPLAADQRQISYSCPPGDWVLHRAQPNEIFDPSVATDVEPRGWAWLQGTLLRLGNQALLCDGNNPVDCPSGAVARGIDPATVAPGGVAGMFVGRVHDGAIEGLTFVPDPEAAEAP